ncbi:MAG: hypothetical protein ACRDDM_00590 [Paraclostridium sp.]
MVSEDIIKSWGIPESLKDKNIEFIFNNDDLNSDLKNNEIIQNLLCDGTGANFCLYDKENKKIIFTMNFIILETDEDSLFIITEKYIKLICLCVNDFEMRDKGIAKYYLGKLIELGIFNKISEFKLSPNPDSELFDTLNKINALKKEKLKDFYIKTFEEFGFYYKYFDEDDKESDLVFSKFEMTK